MNNDDTINLQNIRGLIQGAIIQADALKEAANELRKKTEEIIAVLMLNRRNVSIARMVGGGTSIGIGVPLMIVGIALSPFTFGASLICTAVGGGVSLAGGLTAGGAQLEEIRRARKALKELPEVQKRFNNLHTEFWQTCCNIRQLQTQRLQHHIAGAGAHTALHGAAALGQAGVTVARIVLAFADDVVFAAARTGVVAGAAVGRIVLNGVFVAAAAAIDVYTIADAAWNTFRRDKRTTLVRRLQDELTDRLENDMIIVERTIARFARTLDVQDPVLYALHCAICFETFTPPPVRCPGCQTMVACRGCLAPWLERNGTCPCCRHDWPLTADGDGTPQRALITAEHLVHGMDDLLIEMAERDRNE